MMDTERILGYLLLSLGLGIIFYSIFSALPVFSGTKDPPQIFKLEKSAKNISIGGVEIPGLEVVPVDYLNISGNIGAFIIFLWFLVAAGGRIAQIGVSMLNVRKT